jgi:hypothetical protein
MEYEFKVVKMCASGCKSGAEAFDNLQAWFDQGWEYVDNIQQRGVEYPAFGVVIKRLKPKQDLI